MAPLRNGMVGRDAELARLVELAADAREGRGSVVVVSGEAGAGNLGWSRRSSTGFLTPTSCSSATAYDSPRATCPSAPWRRCATMRSRRWPTRPSQRHDRQPKNVRRAALPRQGRRRIGAQRSSNASRGAADPRSRIAAVTRSGVMADHDATNQQVSTRMGHLSQAASRLSPRIRHRRPQSAGLDRREPPTAEAVGERTTEKASPTRIAARKNNGPQGVGGARKLGSFGGARVSGFSLGIVVRL
jgi:hypothetical protein